MKDLLAAVREVHAVPAAERIDMLSAIANMLALRAGFFRLSPQDFIYFRLYERHLS